MGAVCGFSRADQGGGFYEAAFHEDAQTIDWVSRVGTVVARMLRWSNVETVRGGLPGGVEPGEPCVVACGVDDQCLMDDAQLSAGRRMTSAASQGRERYKNQQGNCDQYDNKFSQREAVGLDLAV